MTADRIVLLVLNAAALALVLGLAYRYRDDAPPAPGRCPLCHEWHP